MTGLTRLRLSIETPLILTREQQEVIRWFWVEGRALSEIASWLGCSHHAAKIKVFTLRAIYASHGIELPKFDKGRPRTLPPELTTAA